MLNNEFIKIISNSSIVTIFRHVNPDMDAIGSQFALKYWIEENFPDIKVYALGNECIKTYISDTVDDEIIKNSVAIILDTANKERIDDSRFSLAKSIIKIDHHPNLDEYGNLNYVDTISAATCQILSEFFLNNLDKFKMNSLISSTLYKGILSDTLCFKTNNTTSNTILIASKLAKFNINISKLNQEVFSVSFDRFNLITELRSKLQLNSTGKLGYVILDNLYIENIGIKAGEIRSYIAEFSIINELEIWCMFTEKPNGLYDGSIRSKNVVINTIANRYNGGGHNNASGVKNLTLEDVKKLLNELENIA